MTLQVLIVDDEALARARLRTLLGDCRQPEAVAAGEAASAAQASSKSSGQKGLLSGISKSISSATGSLTKKLKH